MFKKGVYLSPLIVMELLKDGWLKREDVKYSLKASAWEFKDHFEQIMEHFKDKIVAGLGKSGYKTVKNKREYFKTYIERVIPF